VPRFNNAYCRARTEPLTEGRLSADAISSLSMATARTVGSAQFSSPPFTHRSSVQSRRSSAKAGEV